MLRGGNGLRAVNKANEVINIDNRKIGLNRANNVPIFALQAERKQDSRMENSQLEPPYTLTMGCYSGVQPYIWGSEHLFFKSWVKNAEKFV